MNAKGLWALPAILLLAAPVLAAETPAIVLEGTVAADGPAFVLLPFEVPAGTREVEVRHRSLEGRNILDWGVHDPAGFRGWGGGNREPAIIGDLAASRSYLPGPMPAGTWEVVLGKAQILEEPAGYRVEIFLRETPSLEPGEERRPYAHVPALETGARWYAGDFHVHSRESGDARPYIDEIATFARGRGLDFVALSDHNTVSHLDLIPDAQARHPELLLMPAVEYTTYGGHANAFGITGWVDHRIGVDGLTVEAAARAYADQGALFSINHPVLDLGDLCIGCAWMHDIDPSLVGAVEIATGGWRESSMLFTGAAIAFWDRFCAEGHRIPAIGGSDDHRAGKDLGSFQSPIGNPTTMVFASALSVPALLEGLKAGRTVVKLQGPDDPMIELFAGDGLIGDLVRGDRLTLRAVVTGAAGGELRLVHNGEVSVDVEIDADPFVHEVPVSPVTGLDRWRAEVHVGGSPRTVTSHLWIAPPEPEADVGCGCRSVGPALAFMMPALVLLLRRRRG